MYKDRLKPYVHKIKGARNYALFDMLNEKLYQITPEGSIESLREQLNAAGVIFETDAIVPYKVSLNVNPGDVKLVLRKLLIGINGYKEHSCWKRDKIEKKKPMTDETLDIIISEFHSIPIQKLVIESEIFDESKVSKLLKSLNFQEFELVLGENIPQEKIEKLEDTASEVNIITGEAREYPIEEQIVSSKHFFYNQFYNPCLGHQIAIDTQGEIRSCLWAPEEIGNVHRAIKIKDMIVSGVFDQFWELTKDKIEVCCDCEYRYNCSDCRVFTEEPLDKYKSKPEFCKYDPYKGV